jgi:hypothetical protein
MNKQFNKNPFNKTTRGLEYYKKLQVFAEQELSFLQHSFFEPIY